MNSIYQLSDRDDLEKIDGQEGDLAIVDDGAFTRVYSFKLGEWYHNQGYCCPVRVRANEDEPNV